MPTDLFCRECLMQKPLGLPSHAGTSWLRRRTPVPPAHSFVPLLLSVSFLRLEVRLWYGSAKNPTMGSA